VLTAWVVDASLLVATLVVEDGSDRARTALEGVLLGGGHAPSHLRLEVVNALAVKVRRGVIDRPYRRRALEVFLGYGLTFDTQGDADAALRRALELADAHRLTIYDAVYLELALRLDASLATLDGDVRKAAQAEGVEVAP